MSADPELSPWRNRAAKVSLVLSGIAVGLGVALFLVVKHFGSLVSLDDATRSTSTGRYGAYLWLGLFVTTGVSSILGLVAARGRKRVFALTLSLFVFAAYVMTFVLSVNSFH